MPNGTIIDTIQSQVEGRSQGRTDISVDLSYQAQKNKNAILSESFLKLLRLCEEENFDIIPIKFGIHMQRTFTLLRRPPTVPPLEKIGEIKALLSKDKILMEIIDEIKETVDSLLVPTNKEYKTKIFLRRDIEIPDWEEIVFSVEMRERNFKEINELWNEISDRTEAIMELGESIYGKEEISRVDEEISIEVKKMKNV